MRMCTFLSHLLRNPEILCSKINNELFHELCNTYTKDAYGAYNTLQHDGQSD